MAAPQKWLTRCRTAVGAATLGLLAAFTAMPPAEAAERIRFQYGPFGFSITRQDLETFAETGEADGWLQTLLTRLGAGQSDQVRAALQARYDVDAVLVNRFSYTSSGRQLLTEAGKLVRTESGKNGLYGLRAALTLASADPEGLTLLNVLEAFPTDIRIDIGYALGIARDVGGLLAQSQDAMAQLAEDAVPPAGDLSSLPDPRQTGGSSTTVQTLTLYDASRDRRFGVDVYTPDAVYTPDDQLGQLPVIVISNGLGARRSRFDELALHLASHGFAVAMLDHPGSDRQRLQEFYQGIHTENFEAAEYVDRPLDVSFLLDELTRLNGERFGDRLAPERAGVFGYSFGGTTALALAGATIDRDHLRQACATRSGLFNISLLYQCRALELPPTQVALQDERIQAIYVFVPFGRSLYGPQGLAQVEGPVFWEATEYDVLTPLPIEQLPGFSWLTAEAGTSSDRYLVITQGLPHARLTLDVVNRLTNQAIAWETIKPITETYHQMLSLSFFQVHLAEAEDYRPYLQAGGIRQLEQAPYRLLWRQGCLDCQNEPQGEPQSEPERATDESVEGSTAGR
ncbi:MAG: alpha/beta hydrolase [Elainellaceae cyanobacterium]